MNTELQLLEESLLEIITWIKSDEPMPNIASEIVAYGRFVYSVKFSFFTSLLWLSMVKMYQMWDDTKSGDRLFGFVGILYSSLLLVSFICASFLLDGVSKVWFMPRTYVVEKLSELFLEV